METFTWLGIVVPGDTLGNNIIKEVQQGMDLWKVPVFSTEGWIFGCFEFNICLLLQGELGVRGKKIENTQLRVYKSDQSVVVLQQLFHRYALEGQHTCQSQCNIEGSSAGGSLMFPLQTDCGG